MTASDLTTAPRLIERLDRRRRTAGKRLSYLTGVEKLRNRLNPHSDRDLWFIWIPKSAGTSVYTWLEAELGMPKLKLPYQVKGGFPQRGPVTFGHLSTEALLREGLVSRAYFERSYKFAFVRNPYERAVSLFYYLRRLDQVAASESFTDFLSRVADEAPAIGLFNWRGLSQASPQTAWLLDVDGKMLADEVFRVENFDQACATLAGKLGIGLSIKHENRSERQVGSADLYRDGRAADLVRRIYRSDFEQLGYDPDATPA